MPTVTTITPELPSRLDVNIVLSPGEADILYTLCSRIGGGSPQFYNLIASLCKGLENTGAKKINEAIYNPIVPTYLSND